MIGARSTYGLKSTERTLEVDAMSSNVCGGGRCMLVGREEEDDAVAVGGSKYEEADGLDGGEKRHFALGDKRPSRLARLMAY